MALKVLIFVVVVCLSSGLAVKVTCYRNCESVVALGWELEALISL